MRYAVSGNYTAITDTETWRSVASIPASADPATAWRAVCSDIRERKWFRSSSRTWAFDTDQYVLEAIKSVSDKKFRIMRDGEYILEPNGNCACFSDLKRAQEIALRYADKEARIAAHAAAPTEFREGFAWAAPLQIAAPSRHVVFMASNLGTIIEPRMNFIGSESEREAARLTAEKWAVRNAIGYSVARIAAEGVDEKVASQMGCALRFAEDLGLPLVETAAEMGAFILSRWGNGPSKENGSMWACVNVDAGLPPLPAAVDPRVRALVQQALQDYRDHRRNRHVLRARAALNSHAATHATAEGTV